MNRKIFGRKRAVSETIGTLLILMITVVGAVLIANFVKDGFFAVDQSYAPEARVDSVQLTGYDTRDAEKLINVEFLDNVLNQMLCISGNPPCAVTDADQMPSAGGTEFIAIQIRNRNVDSIFLHSISINNIEHKWDQLTANQDLVPPASYPKAGMFSIIPAAEKNSIEQKATIEVRGDEEVRVIIKLNSDIHQDIGMSDSVRIAVNFGGTQPAVFNVLSGDAKW